MREIFIIFQDVGKETSLNLKLNLSIVNALWLLLSGERFSLEDPKLKAIVSKFDAALRLGSNSTLHQLLGAISPILTKIFNPGYATFMELFRDIKDVIVAPVMNDHKESMDLDNPRDFMDVYLTHIAKTNDPNSSFHGKRGEESLISTMIDLFLAGTYVCQFRFRILKFNLNPSR